MSAEMEFDLGPLTWVKGEIDNALDAARTALESWAGEEVGPLKAAAAHLHQVYGALQIVDLQGLSLLTAETERLLAEMAEHPDKRGKPGVDAAIAAIAALKGYLDGLMAGAPHAEIKLAPVLDEVVARRGGEALAPSELFYPDTGVRVPRKEPELPMDDEARARAIRRARSQYQRGLLQYLQNREPMAGLQLMDQSVRMVEKLAPGPAQFTFWWTAAGLMDLLRRGGAPTDFWLKRLCGRIDLQMRRLMEGSRQLADRLFRDVLYYIAQDPAPTGRTADARSQFALERYFPVEAAGSDDQRVHLGNLKDNLASAKDHWIRYCSGHSDSLEPFQHAAQALFEAATRLPNAAMQTLTRIIQAVAKRLPGVADATQNEALQLEMATGLMLALNAAEHFHALGGEFEKQSDVQAMRLQAAIDPDFDLSRIPDVDLLDEFSRRAQEKLVVAQVGQEIKNNLNQVEEILDRFFRNATERAGLPMVPGLMKQILGALNVLQLDVAGDLVNETMKRIGHFTEPDAEIAPENLNWVAESLSTLGIYLDALRYGRDDIQSLTSLLARPEVVTRPAEESVEAQIRQDTERLKESVEEWVAGGADEEKKEVLKSELDQLARDADLVGDADLKGQADAALQALQAASAPEAVQEAVASLGGAPTAAPAPSAEARRLAQASDEVVDQELLSTYIEEANEVLGTIAVQTARLQVSPYDKEAFTVVRRGFHTLKGSGRMVGLTDLAEVAWEVEQTLNQWLRDEKAPNSDMLGFLEDTAGAFQVWVQELEEQGRARVEAEHVVHAARVLRGDAEARQETPPPKPEAGVPEHAARIAGSPAEQGETGEVMGVEDSEDMVDIEGHQLPGELFRIFSAEAGHRLTDLTGAVDEVASGHRPTAWENLMRAAHTLAGISRTTGFLPLADAAHELELWAGTWPDKTRPLGEAALPVVTQVVDLLREAVADILAGRYPEDQPQVRDLLACLAPPEPQAEALEETGLAVEENVPPTEAAEESRAVEPREEREAPEASGPPPADGEPAPVAEAPPSAAPPSFVMPPRQDETAPPPARNAPAARDELDEELLPVFLEETGELMPRIGETLRDWRTEPDSTAARDELKRALHTLKGSARMAGAMVLGESVHALETRVIELSGGEASAEFLDELEEAYDRFAEIIERLKGGEAPPAPLAAAVAEAEGEALLLAGELPLAEVAAHTEALPAPPAEAAPAPAPTKRAAKPAAGHKEDTAKLRQSLRLKSDILDTLLNEAGEVAIARARIENVLNAYKQTAQELSSNVERLRGQLRELEIQAESQMRSRLSQVDESHFDPLEFDRFSRLQELTRLMAESVNDVSTAQDNLLAGLNEADGALIQQSRMARTLQQELMRLRMVPLGTLSERLHRVVRQAAKETGRKAQLEVDGSQTELDRAVLDKIAAPLEHLVRNAVAHGIEAADARQTAGKREFGEVRLGARQEGNEIVLTLSDDGSGINFAAVEARAREHGWLKPDEKPTPELLEQLLFRSGFSTAEKVTELAGRGVGLDVVKNEIAGIGGRVHLQSTPGQGSTFTIRLPLTLALTQVVLARAGGQTWALPANLVTLVREVRADQVHALHEAGRMELSGESYPLRTLAELVGRTAQPAEGRYRTILMLKAGSQRLAIRVDALEGNFEAVVKNIGPQLARIAGLSGATVLGDGRVALILNPFQLAERAPRLSVAEEEATTEQAPLVMVVDDSLTVRKITSRFLEREGFRVVAARDGVEALEMLEDELPIIMLLDIEMPRMDGFEVARNVRSNSTTRSLPIIMITSRTAEKHRSHALELGVDAYMGKPYQEEELLGEIHRLTQLTAML
ncbi:MAG: Hpt domain-containing protein [Pseudomonadota bacterium]